MKKLLSVVVGLLLVASVGVSLAETSELPYVEVLKTFETYILGDWELYDLNGKKPNGYFPNHFSSSDVVLTISGNGEVYLTFLRTPAEASGIISFGLDAEKLVIYRENAGAALYVRKAD